MFTGIIRELGTVQDVVPEPDAMRITIQSGFESLRPGDSIAVNGACLTALEVHKNSWTMRLMQETLQKTNLGSLRQGTPINLERSLLPTQRLDGHFVMGHIDGVATVTAITAVGDDRIFTFEPPAPLMKYVVPKGSVALDGVSLTVVDVSETTFTVSIMPYTLSHTTFGTASIGSPINIEVDILGKYVERLVSR